MILQFPDTLPGLPNDTSDDKSSKDEEVYS